MMNEDGALMSNTVKKEKEQSTVVLLQTRDWKQCIAIAIHCQ
jgi:hypothetical protein